MNSNAKILMITDGNVDHASSRIRALQYIPYLQAEGFLVKWLPRIPLRGNKTFLNRLHFAVQKRIHLLKIYFTLFIGNHTIIFFQRFFLNSWLLSYCKAKNIKIIFDFDDAIYISSIDQKAEEKTISMLKAADLVITSCPVLNTFSGKFNKNSKIITSPVDGKKIFPAHKKDNTITIGWMGSEWTSKYLSVLVPVFNRLSQKYSFRLLLVGAHKQPKFNCETKYEAWSLESENRLLNEMDIGIMPLLDTEFEQAKGGFKLFQYMAAGKPILASPVGINQNIVQQGENGFLCVTETDWYNSLSYLIENESERMRLGKRGREIFEEKYSLEVCVITLIENLKKL